VLKALLNAGIEFVVVFPDASLKDEYVQRYKDRGSPDSFVKLLDENFVKWVTDLQTFCVSNNIQHYVLGKGAYLSNALDVIQKRNSNLITVVTPHI
jgi:hypothetical protein